MPDYKEIQKTIEAVESLLPFVKSDSFRVDQAGLLELGKQICKAYESALSLTGEVNETILVKLERGTNAMLKSVLLQIENEKTLVTKNYT
jgi:hypothetical protein